MRSLKDVMLLWIMLRSILQKTSNVISPVVAMVVSAKQNEKTREEKKKKKKAETET